MNIASWVKELVNWEKPVEKKADPIPTVDKERLEEVYECPSCETQYSGTHSNIGATDGPCPNCRYKGKFTKVDDTKLWPNGSKKEVKVKKISKVRKIFEVKKEAIQALSIGKEYTKEELQGMGYDIQLTTTKTEITIMDASGKHQYNATPNADKYKIISVKELPSEEQKTLDYFKENVKDSTYIFRTMNGDSINLKDWDQAKTDMIAVLKANSDSTEAEYIEALKSEGTIEADTTTLWDYEGKGLKVIGGDTTYNWSTFAPDVHIAIFKVEDKEEFAAMLSPHLGGDARGNYGDGYILIGTDRDDLNYRVSELLQGDTTAILEFSDGSSITFDGQGSDVNRFEVYGEPTGIALEFSQYLKTEYGTEGWKQDGDIIELVESVGGKSAALKPEGKGGKKEIVKEIEERKNAVDPLTDIKRKHKEKVELFKKKLDEEVKKYKETVSKESSLKEIKAAQSDINVRPSFIKYCKSNSHYWAVNEKEAKWYKIPAELENDFTKFSILNEGFMKGEEDCPTCKEISKKKAVKVETGKLQEGYIDFEEFKQYSDTYGLAKRLGFATAEEAWEANPLIQFSADPKDYKIVDKEEKIETEAAPETELPVKVKKERIPPEQVDELQKKSPKLSDEVVELAKLSNSSLQALADAVKVLQEELTKAEEKAEEAREKVLAKEKVPERIEKIRAIALDLSNSIGKGKEAAVILKNEILAKLETQTENIKYKYPKETEEKVLKHIKELEKDKKEKADKYVQELDAKITEFKEKSAESIEKLITTEVRVMRFPKKETSINREGSIFTVFQGIINSIKSWTSGLLGLANEIKSL